jgi:hypothetical protein
MIQRNFFFRKGKYSKANDMPTLGVLRQTNLEYARGVLGVTSSTFDWSESEY